MKRALLGQLVLLASMCAITQSAASQHAADAAHSTQFIDELVLANHILANEGVCDGYGHVSTRHPRYDERFILAKAVAPAVVSAKDLLEFGLNGQPIASTDAHLPAERFIHAAIYEARREVTAVVHCHPPSVIAFANSSVLLRPMSGESAFLLAGVPVFEGRDVEGAGGILVADMRMGRALAQVLSQKAVVLMRGHGAVIVGGSIREAVARSIYLDVNAKMQAQAILLGGTIRYLEPTDRAFSPATEDTVRAAGAIDRAWQHWKWRVPAHDCAD